MLAVQLTKYDMQPAQVEQTALEALKAKQEAVFAARPSEALAVVQTQLAAVEKELVVTNRRREA